MTNNEEASVKLTNTQLNKLKSAAKNKTGTTLRITKKNFRDEDLSHSLFLTIRKETKMRYAFANNVSTDINLVKQNFLKPFNQVDFLVLCWLN